MLLPACGASVAQVRASRLRTAGGRQQRNPQLTSLKRSIARLQALQLLALALPIIVQPWLAQHLQPFAYGRLVFVAAAATYFSLFCDFGFGWSATRAIAIHRDDPQKRSELVSTTLAARLLLCALGFVILLLLTQFVEALRSEAWLLFTAYAGVLGTALTPAWYFQGMERAQLGIYLDIAGRVFSLALIVLLVAQPSDIWPAVAAIASGQLLTGLLGLVLLLREPDLHWLVPRRGAVLAALRTGFPLFLSTSAVSLYTAASALALGLISTREQVAYFGAAQRVIAAGSVVLNPFNQVFYPRISLQMQHSPAEAVRSVGTALWVQGAVGLLLSIALFVTAEPLTRLLFGTSFTPAADCLKLMAPVPFLVAVASAFANLVIMALHRDRTHLAMTSGAAVINIAVVVMLARSHGAAGAAVALLAAECFVVLFAVAVGSKLLRNLSRSART
jgi:polysaccharide transporter, PST family